MFLRAEAPSVPSERGSVTLEEGIVQKIMTRDFIAVVEYLNAINTIGFDINKNGILHSAVALGEADMSILKLILKYPSININQLSARVSNRNRAVALTPLQVAIVGAGINHALIFHLLDEVEVDPHVRDGAGRTALYYAIEACDLTLVEALVRREVGINISDHEGITPLFFAIHLITDEKKLVGQSYEATFLEKNSTILSIVDCLMRHDARIDSSCLYRAIDLKNVQLMTLLLTGNTNLIGLEKRGADIPLLHAIRLMTVEEDTVAPKNKDNADLMKIIYGLLKNEARPDVACVSAAIDLKNVELVNLLLRAGVDLAQMGANGEGLFRRMLVGHQLGDSLLHKAIAQYSLILCDLLLRYGADINITNRAGNSPLHSAIIALNTLRSECSALHVAEKKLITDEIAPTRPRALVPPQGEFNQQEQDRKDEIRRNLEANKALQALKKKQVDELKKIILFLFRGPINSPHYDLETDHLPLRRLKPALPTEAMQEIISIPARRPWPGEIEMNCNPFGMVLDNPNVQARTPLYLAIEGGLMFVVELLLSNKVDPNRLHEALPEAERTPLQFALTVELPGCVDVLLKGGASVCNYKHLQKLPLDVLIERWAGEVNRTDLDLSGFTQLWNAILPARQKKLTACANSLLWYGAGIARVIPLALRAMPINMTNSCLFFAQPETVKEWYPNAVYTQQEFLDNQFLKGNAPLKSLLECTTVAYGLGNVTDLAALRLLRGFLEARLPTREGGMSLVSLIHLTMRGRGLERYKNFLYQYDELETKVHEIKLDLPVGGVVCLDPTNRLAGSEPLRYNYRATSTKILEQGHLRGQPAEIKSQMEVLQKRVHEKNSKALTKKSRKKKTLGNLRFDFPQQNDDGTVQVSYSITAWKLGHFYLTDRRRENPDHEALIADNHVLLAPARLAAPRPEDDVEEIPVSENAVHTATLMIGLPREFEGRQVRHLGPLIAAPAIRQGQADNLQATVQNRRNCFQDLGCGFGIATFLPVYLWLFLCFPWMLMGRGFCFADTIGSLFSRSTHHNASRDEYLPTDWCWVFVAMTLGLAFVEIALVGLALFFTCRQSRLNRAERELIHDIELEALSAPRAVPVHYNMDSGLAGLNNALPRIAARGEAARRQEPALLGRQNALFGRDGLWASSQTSEGERDRLVINPPWNPPRTTRDPYTNQNSSAVREEESDAHDFTQGGYQNSLDL